MTRKAQAAMEFLMTYGWAILVVLAAIGALAYFGVLSPDTLLPERCTGPSGLDCVDKASIAETGGLITVAMKNNLGQTINVSVGQTVSSELTGGGCGSDGYVVSVSGTSTNGTVKQIANNDNLVLVVDCGTITAGRFKDDVGFTYVNADSGVSHKAVVSIRGKAS